MTKINSMRKRSKRLSVKTNQDEKPSSIKASENPTRAKFVLFIFGVGPIIIMFVFLTMNGFF